MPENTVKVDRSTKWGNPFRGFGYETREKQAFRFRAAVLGNEYTGPPRPHPESYIGKIIADAPKELRGKNLACWCPPGTPCHADALLELANSPGSISSADTRPK